MKENENMEEKSNHDKYKDAVYKDGKTEDLFRMPRNPANFILKYCDDRTLVNVLHVNKSWNKKINEWKLGKRKEYLKYFMWYVYGHGNAERLCKIVDDVANKNVVNKVDQNKNKPINEDKNKDEDKKILLWFMILLDILNIKMADLKLDFDKEKSKSIEEAIKNHLLRKEAVKRRNDFIDTKIMSDHPEGFLWEYSRQIFPEFKNVQAKSENYWDNIDVNVSTAELLERTFACFLKVAFYQIKRVEDSNIDGVDDPNMDGVDPKIYKQRKNKIRYFNHYLNEQIFDRLEIRLDDGTIKYQRGEVKITSSIAAYLFETEELETWFHDYNKDFFDFFCTPSYFICCDDGETIVEFFGFAFYLNKIKSFETRYRENPDEFWQTFYKDIVEEHTFRGSYVLIDITSFISQKDLKDKMKGKAESACNRIFREQLFKQNSEKLDLEKNYFKPIIIRFYGQKDLSDKVIQSISKVIESKNGVDPETEAQTNVAINPVSTNPIPSNKINLIDKNEISNANNKLNGNNQIGFWRHFLFGLFCALTCLSLILCFEISFLYFILPFVICFIVALCLGFKNYCRSCCCTQKIETPVNDKDKNGLATIHPIEPNQNLIDDEIEIPKHI